jgi:DNA-binding MarR family transcriptional regulator
MTALDPGLDLGVLLALGYQEFVRRLHADLAQRGYDDLGRSDGYVFRALAEASLTTSALAARLDVSKQAAGQIVEDMTRRGYLTSRPDPDDGRARLLELTQRGRGALAAARSFHRRYEQRLARELGHDEVATLRRVLIEMAPADPGGVIDPRVRALFL